MTLRLAALAALLTFGALAFAQDAPQPKPSARAPQERPNRNPAGDAPRDAAEPSQPEATDPEATDPKATGPKATGPEATDPKASGPKASDPKAPRPRRDPTAGAIGPLVGGAGGSRQRGFPLPQVQLKARILAKGKKPAALIDVEGNLYLVLEGSTITLQGRGFGLLTPPVRATPPRPRAGSERAGQAPAPTRAGYTSYALHVISIDANEVRIEFTGRNETITVR